MLRNNTRREIGRVSQNASVLTSGSACTSDATMTAKNSRRTDGSTVPSGSSHSAVRASTVMASGGQTVRNNVCAKASSHDAPINPFNGACNRVKVFLRDVPGEREARS